MYAGIRAAREQELFARDQQRLAEMQVRVLVCKMGCILVDVFCCSFWRLAGFNLWGYSCVAFGPQFWGCTAFN